MSLIPSNALHPHLLAYAAGSPIVSTLPTLITANDGITDSVAVTGETIDTLAQRGDSMIFGVVCAAYCSDGKTLKVAAELQESSNGSAWDTAEALYAATTICTGTASVNTFHGVKIAHVDMRMRKRYIRFNFTPNLSSTASPATDFATAGGFALMGGGKVVPTF